MREYKNTIPLKSPVSVAVLLIPKQNKDAVLVVEEGETYVNVEDYDEGGEFHHSDYYLVDANSNMVNVLIKYGWIEERTPNHYYLNESGSDGVVRFMKSLPRT